MSNNLILKKKEIRKEILKKRLNLTESEKNFAEIQMIKFLSNWEVFKTAKIIHIFVSKKNEPRTGKIIKFCWDSLKQVNVPYVGSNKEELFHSKLNSLEDLSVGNFGVLEPLPKKIVPSKPENFDIVLVPGIAFDIHGSRIGYGKGYYDRFLLKTKAFRLALAFDFQVLKNVPSEKHDMKMNGIITESRMIIL